MIEKLGQFFKKHEAYLQAFFFISGFIFDLLTLSRIDDTLTLLLQSLYLFILLSILLSEMLDLTFPQNLGPISKIAHFFGTHKDEFFHFLLGALLSAFTIFYFKSASLANSFIFMMVMALLLLLNEWPFFKKQGLVIRIAMLTLCLFSYFLFTTALLIKSTGPLIFILSTICTLLCIAAVYYGAQKTGFTKARAKTILLPSLSVVFLFIVLAWLKLIPPVPLAIKHIGIYHKVEREGEHYRLSHQRPWWRFWHRGDQRFYARAGDQIYVFVRIFSPRGFGDQVVLHWRYWDPERGWLTADKIPLRIAGGRDDGFRGFAYKGNFREGQWQIKVQTRHELEIGRIYFQVINDHENEDFKVYYTELH